MMTIKFKITGVKETKALLDNASQESLQQVDAAVTKAGFYMESEVKASISGERAELMSVDTGRFRGSVKMTKPVPLQSEVSSDVEYAKFLEYGTSKLPPRQHFRNSVQRNIEKVREFIKDAVKQAVG